MRLELNKGIVAMSKKPAFKRVPTSKGLNFPSDQMIKEVLKELRGRPGTIIPPKDASNVDKLKYSICQQLVRFFNKNNLTQVQLAAMLDLSPSAVSRILHYKVSAYTVDFLVKNLDKITSYSLEVTFKQNKKAG